MMTQPELTELVGLAADLARTAGAEALAFRDHADLGVDTKSSAVDLVTRADRQAERFITEQIRRARPDDAIVGEEGAADTGTSGLTWVIDPIDGTTNYVYGLPAFGVSIAVESDGETIVGVVYDPSHDKLFAATRGGGATMNGEALACSTKGDLATALVATGFSYLSDRRRQQAHVLVALLPRVRDIRRFGSAALDLCAVAEGTVDGYFERGLNHWDLAAGALIAAEAGAVVGDLDGGPASPTMTLAAAPAIFGELRDLLTASSA